MKELSPVTQRIFAVALAFLTCWAAWWLLIQWWLLTPLAEISEEEKAVRAAYLRYAALNSQRDDVQRQLDAVEQLPLPAGSLLSADSLEAATAEIMQLLIDRTLSGDSTPRPCIVVNRLPKRPSVTGALQRVGVEAELECGVESFAATLYRLENTTPYLKVEAFEVRSAPAEALDETGLNIRLHVIGLVAQAKSVSHD